MYELAHGREDVVVGLDMGNVLNHDCVVTLDNLHPKLLERGLKVGDFVPPELYRYRQEVDGSIEGTKAFIDENGPNSVKIFKNSVLGDFSDEQALDWLEEHDFNRRTGGRFTRDRNLFLPETRAEKAYLWVRELTTDAVEDRIQVGRHILAISKVRWIWMLSSHNLKELDDFKPYIHDPPVKVQIRTRSAFDWTDIRALVRDRSWGRTPLPP